MSLWEGFKNESPENEDYFTSQVSQGNLDQPEKRWRVVVKKTSTICRANALLLLTMGGVVAGIVVALLVLQFAPPLTPREVKYVKFPGEIFLRALNMIILPLIVSSIVCGLADLGATSGGKMGVVALGYYFTTTILAAIQGIVCVVMIQPGKRGSVSYKNKQESLEINAADNFLDLIRNMIPDNLVAAAFQKYKTVTSKTTLNVTINNVTEELIAEVPSGTVAAGSNILGLVVFSVLLGGVLGRVGPEARPLIQIFRSLNVAIMHIVQIFMYYSPIGIAFLICGQILQSGQFLRLLHKLGFYILTVLLGHFTHALIALPLLFFLFTRSNPFRFIWKTSQALLTAFGTSSSSATLPVTMECVVEGCGIDPRVAQFVLPIGATINMDGTALYEAIAALFIAQMRNIQLSVPQIITVSLTATLASVGAAGIPTAGMVTMLIVLNAVNLPVEDISLLLAVDWFLDRFRTAANVSGDTIGAAIVDHLCRRDPHVKDDERPREVDEDSAFLGGDPQPAPPTRSPTSETVIAMPEGTASSATSNVTQPTATPMRKMTPPARNNSVCAFEEARRIETERLRRKSETDGGVGKDGGKGGAGRGKWVTDFCHPIKFDIVGRRRRLTLPELYPIPDCATETNFTFQ